MGTTNTITNLTLAGLLLTCLGCERGLNRRQTEFAEETWLNACNDLKAQVKGMDEEIDLRLWRVWDVKWKDKIYHVVEPGLVDQMRKDEEAIIQARAKRAELEYRANSMVPPDQVKRGCDIEHIDWELYETEILACQVPVRDDNPDGYSLLSGSCKNENDPRIFGYPPPT